MLTSQETRKVSDRSRSLDALRGLAIFGMMFSGCLPWDGLPRWMYHGQEPPPTHDFNPHLAALTWVDLVFPFFLFSMGVAIPLALQKLSREPPSRLASLLRFLCRFGLLVAFALLNQHYRPYVLNSSPDTATWLLGLWGFVVVFLLYVRLPQNWSNTKRALIRLGGLGAIAGSLPFLKYQDVAHPGISLERSDPIILVLATCSVFASTIWFLTQERPNVRAFLMAALLALRVSAETPGSWADAVWNYSGPTKWFFHPSYLGYLLVVIPGTFVGDLLIRASESSPGVRKTSDRWAGILAFLALPASLYVFFERIYSFWLLPIAMVLGVLGSRSKSSTVSCLLTWGATLLTIGILLEPFEGGIKKDHPTLSYLTATPGLAMLLLCAFILLERRFPHPPGFKFASDTGRNPLLAYQALTNLVAPMWALTIGGWVADRTPGIWLGLIRALVQTLLLGAVVSLFTRAKIFFRA